MDYEIPSFTSPVTAASPHIFNVDQEDYNVDPTVPLGARRKIRIIHIGGGFAGLNMAYHVKKYTKDVELICYEKNKAIGGTWYENKYPGCTCDIPSHSYQFTWAIKTDWTKYYSPSDEIEQYGQWVAKTHDLYKYIKLEHEVVSCKWDETTGKWQVQIRGPDGKVFTDSGEVLINGSGILNNWAWPKIPNRESFRGEIIHSARWRKDVELRGKRVAVIGVGATAVQIVPEIQPEVDSLTVFMRSKTWITPGFAAKYAGKDGGNFEYSPQQKQDFVNDPEAYHQYRKALEVEVSSRFRFVFMGSDDQKAALKASREIMESKLKNKPELIEQIVPAWSVGCRRPTPGLGFLDTLCTSNTNLISEKIKLFSEKGLVTEDGTEHEFDVIICATGFETSFVPRFPIIGRDNIDIRHQWADIAEAYFGIAVANFPNYFITGGPSSPVAQGTLLPILELLARYYLKFVQKLQIEPNLRSFSVKPEIIRDFAVHRLKQLKLTAWSGQCSSWFKRGTVNGPNVAIHPGSRTHFFSAINEPRMEDYDFTYDGNRFTYLGNGFALREVEGRDLGYYLDDYREEKPFLFDY